MDAHRLSKISGSFNPFTEKETLAPGWPLNISFFQGEPVGVGGAAICTCDPCGYDPPMCVCVCGLVCVVCVRVCVEVTASARVFVFQCVSVSLCFVRLSMSSKVLLCY